MKNRKVLALQISVLFIVNIMIILLVQLAPGGKELSSLQGNNHSYQSVGTELLTDSEFPFCTLID